MFVLFVHPGCREGACASHFRPNNARAVKRRALPQSCFSSENEPLMQQATNYPKSETNQDEMELSRPKKETPCDKSGSNP